MAVKNNKIDLDTISEKAKKKKDFLIMIVIVSILGFLFFSIGMAFLNSNKSKSFKERADKKINEKTINLLPEKDFKESWAISVENSLQAQNKLLEKFMKTMNKNLKDTKTQLQSMIVDSVEQQKKALQDTEKRINNKIEKLKKDFNDTIVKQNDKIKELEVVKGSINIIAGKNGGKINGTTVGPDLLPPLDKIKKDMNKTAINTDTNTTNDMTDTLLSQAIGKSINNKVLKKEKKEKPVIITKPMILTDIDTSGNKIQIQKQIELAKKIKAQMAKKKNNNYHVMVGLAQAYMITGAYAPVFQAGQENPLPVLLKAEGNIVIANDDTESIDKCFLIGSAKGNMNSQTADIRLVKISCSIDGGKYMIEGPISGWVIGENGIPGVPGELLHKNGAWLAHTFVAGFLQTFSNAFSGNGGATQINLAGTTNTNNGGTTQPIGAQVANNAKSAFGQGLSSVFGQLGKYYLKMAEQIFPVIEVKPGRTVNIFLQGGESLQVKKLNKLDIGTINQNLMNSETNTNMNIENNVQGKEFTVDSLQKKQYTNNTKTAKKNGGNKQKINNKQLQNEMLITE